MNKKEQLKQWLCLWYGQKELELPEDDESSDGTITPEDMKELKSLVRPFDTNIKVGEIRMLSSELVEADRPYYIAVIKEWDADMVLIAPYAPFPVPATQYELETGRDHFSLAVLECWNTRSILTQLLEKSWVVDKLSKQEMEEAFAVFSSSFTGRPLPKELEDRVGLPIVNPKDPRIQYQNQEMELIAPLTRKSMELDN